MSRFMSTLGGKIPFLDVWSFRFRRFYECITGRGIGPVKDVWQFLKCLFTAVCCFQLTFPYNYNTPTKLTENSGITLVASPVPFNFGLPEFSVRFRQAIVFTIIMSVLKTAVDENNGLKTSQHYVWTAGEFFVVQSVTPAHRMQITPYKHLRFCIIAFYRSHITAAFFGRFYICHKRW